MARISVICILSLTACGGQGHNLPPQLQTRASKVNAPAFGDLPRTSAGTLYGTTQRGGNLEACKKATFASVAGCGTVFAITTTGTERILYAFKGGTDGRLPVGALIADASGTLYGTTASGGGSSACIHGCGTAYAVTDSGSERVLHAFAGKGDGSEPVGRLLVDSRGVLYGATRWGGQSHCRCGTIFMLTPSGSGYVKSTIYNFQGGSDGAAPHGGLLADKNGTFYGTTIE
ncbi:MAG: choice-of-anchor tandem repeat GloVer-containing protein, partial [Candidatus Tumulicola sp.]